MEGAREVMEVRSLPMVSCWCWKLVAGEDCKAPFLSAGHFLCALRRPRAGFRAAAWWSFSLGVVCARDSRDVKEFCACLT